VFSVGEQRATTGEVRYDHLVLTEIETDASAPMNGYPPDIKAAAFGRLFAGTSEVSGHTIDPSTGPAARDDGRTSDWGGLPRSHLERSNVLFTEGQGTDQRMTRDQGARHVLRSVGDSDRRARTVQCVH